MRALLEEERLVILGGPAPDARGEFATSVREGLTASSKSLCCRHFYDAEGSGLFEEICRLPEYYLTRTEASILRRMADELVDRMGPAPQLVELGSGSAQKTRILIEALLKRHDRMSFVPIDISIDAITSSSRALLGDFAGLDVHAIADEYLPALRNLPAIDEGSRLVLWLGSSIGNFDRREAGEFLAKLRGSFGPRDAMLIGIDLRKESAVLEAAYDDAAGVTARFNLNLLARINRELGGRFDLDDFSHRATYDDGLGRIEMHLIAKKSMRVRIDALALDVEFEADEAIHTENSYKYSPEEIERLVERSGFRLERQWFDPAELFSLNLLAPHSS